MKMLDSHFILTLARQREENIDRSARRLGPQLAALRERAVARSHEPVTVRFASPDDGREISHLAELDSAPPPAAPILVGERGGRPVAALSLWDGAVIAHPFVPAADVVALLQLRARQLHANAPRRRRRLRLASRLRPQRAGGA